jgi:O-antigen/teichoic acid export membrane protein
MSRTDRYLRGLIIGYGNTLLVTVCGLWLTAFLLDRVGVHDYGLWLIAIQIIGYLMLLDLGVTTLLPRETASAVGRAKSFQEAKDLPVIFGKTIRLAVLQMPLLAGAVIILWFVLPSDWEALRLPLGIIMIATVLLFPLRILQAVLQGLQDLSFLAVVQTMAWTFSTAVTVGLVLYGFGLYGLSLGWVAGLFLSAVLWWYRLKTRYPHVVPQTLPELSRAVVKDQIGRGMWVTVTQLAQVLMNGTELLVIGRLLGPAAVVAYVCTSKLIVVFSNQPMMLVQTALPGLTELRAAQSPRRVLQVCNTLTQATLIVSGLMTCVILLINKGFVAWWVGENQFGGLRLTVLILFSMLLSHWNLTISSTLFCFGYERWLAVTALTNALMSLGAFVVFVRYFGPEGAPLGLIVTVCLISLPANIFALSRETSVPVAHLLKPLVPWFGGFVMCISCVATLAAFWSPMTVPEIVAAVLVSTLLYSVFTVSAIRRQPFATDLLLSLGSVFRRLGIRRHPVSQGISGT